jgi:multiple sugar transport system ATP-binding protein
VSAVEISQVIKRFGTVQTLHGVTATVDEGSFVILVGPSGCGKSTLLRMIAGLETISDGEIRIGGRRVNELSPKDRDVAMVFQSYALYPQMTVAQNMAFSLEMSKTPRSVIKEKINAAAAILELGALMDRYPRQLSGGQRQRVAMGRAIVRDPKVFLFDEPLSNLDAKLRVQMRGEIKALQKRLGTTTIYVTHDQIEAMTMADKIVVLRDGRVEQIGAPLDLYDRPANKFVGSFIGSPSMNFIDGSVQADGAFRTTDGVGIRLASGPTGPTRSVTLGMRPEHIVIDPTSQTQAEVVVVEPTGSETFVVAKLGNQDITCVLKERSNFQAGERIPVSFLNSRPHFFEPKTGQRLS